jgi:hypothetical protein
LPKKMAMLALAAMAQPVGPAAAQAPVEQLSCEQLEEELVTLTGSAVDGVSRLPEMAAKAGPSGSMTATGALATQSLGAVANMLPGVGATVAGTAMGAAQQAEAEKRAEASTEAARVTAEAVSEDQMGKLDRMLALHERHQAHCAG